MRIRSGIVSVMCAVLLLTCTPTLRATSWELTTFMTAGQEIPTPTGVPFNAIGLAQVFYDDVTTELTWQVMWQNLSSDVTGAHFHGPADTSSTASVLLGFSGAAPPTHTTSGGPTTIGWGSDLLAGDVYMNVHTILNVPGEIRGQLGLAGTGPNSPILPSNFTWGAQPFRGQWIFDDRTGTGAWFDPWLAPGFLYETTDGSKFVSVQWPTAFGDLTVSFDSTSQLVNGGDLFFFPEPVDSFTIMGLNPLVDAENPAAFPTFLSFDSSTVSFTMTAIPEPATLIILTAFSAMLLRRKT